MNLKLKQALLKKKPLKLMTHLVLGYPSFEINFKCIQMMKECDVDFIEVQLPFSDPIADGPVITKANQFALNHGITIKKCFHFIKKLTQKINIPICIMTYSNIPYQIEMKSFLEKAKKNGVSGLIIPDFPYDEDDDSFLETAKRKDLPIIQVISPSIQNKRLKKIITLSDSFIYTTLKVGITGSKPKIKAEGLSFLEKVKKITNLPIGAGFGISSAEHLKLLKHKANIAIIGSHLIKLLETKGLSEVEKFLKICQKTLSN